ncbi:MAG: lamin tail domain-containing protein [Bacteroidales bacterium]
MRNIFTLFFAGIILFMPSYLKSQTLAITEINYNDPSGGNFGDSLEFVEVYNILNTDVDLSSYTLASGVTFTFPAATIIPAQGYIIIAKNANAVNTFFGIGGTLQWDAGQGLTNTNGEAVVIKDAAGNTIDSVRYSVNAPWPVTANGLGGSLMKCDPFAMPNLAGSWVAGNINNAMTYGTINNYTVFATPLNSCVLPPVYNPVYAVLPFTETFDNAWMNGSNYRDVPSLCWMNTPATGNNSWRRNDDGYSAYWSNINNGGYTPTGANGTANSARFHTNSVASGLTGELKIYLNFTLMGNKKMKFWYNNTSGTDSLAVYFSDDAGAPFTFLQKYTTTTGWEEKQILLGTSTSTTCIVKFVATSNNTANDLGLDQISIIAAPDNDAGISDISSPPALNFNGNPHLLVGLTNYGNLPLTSVDINWMTDGGTVNTTSWNGNLASGDSETGIDLASLTLTPLTLSQYKVWTSNPNGTNDGDPNNDTLVRNSFYQTRASIPYEEHFDADWMDKFATHDAPSEYWINTPATGNNSLRRDDDGATASWGAMTTGAYTPAGALGTDHSARFHTSGNAVGGTVGILDLFLDFSALTGTKELKFYHINTAGQDSVAIWLSTDNGNSFTYLTKYTVSTAWQLKVVNLGTSVSDQVVLRFRCTSNQGGNTDPGIDEVSISSPQPDIAILNIVSPVTGCNLTNAELVTIHVKNTGSLELNNIPVIYHVDGNIVQETIPNTLNPGDTLTYTFTTPADLSAAGLHEISALVAYPGDYNPLNDSLATVVNHIMQINSFPYLEDFEDAAAENFSLTHNTNAIIGIEAAIGSNNSSGLRMAGNVAATWPSGSGSSTTATQAWVTYADHHAFAMTCMIDGTSLNNPELKLDLRQTFVNGGGNKYSWFRVLVNDTVQLANNNGVLDFNPLTSNADPFVTQTFSLGAFAHTNFKLTLQSSCKYNDANAGGGVGDNAFVDNIIIRERPPIEVAMQSWVSPLSDCGLTSHENVSVKMKNQGSSGIGNIPVSYSIDNGGTWNSEICLNGINSDSTLIYTFTTTANFSATGVYHCIAAVSFPGDADQSNDTIYFTVTSVPYVTINGFYQEIFETGPGGWSSATLAGPDEWELGTPSKQNLNSAHSGFNAWVTSLTEDYSINTNSYIISPCFDFTGLNNPHLSVWLHFRIENNYDAMIMEVSVNDSTWYKITADAGFYNNTSTQPPVTPPKWSGNNNEWTQYMTSLPGLANKSKVQIRFRFVSDYTEVDEGIAIDDIAIFDPFPDATISEVTSPIPGCDLGTQETVTVVIKNDGLTDFTGAVVKYSIDLNPWVYENFLGNIPAGGSTNYTFTTPGDFSGAGLHVLSVQVTAPGDFNLLNDVLLYEVRNILSTGIPLVNDFSGPDMFDYMAPSTASNSSFEISGIGSPEFSAMLSGGPAGNWPNNTDTTTTALQAWGYENHLADIHTCTVTIPSGPGVGLWFDLRQTFSQGNKYSWFRVLINDTTQIPDIWGNLNFNPSTPNSDGFENHLFYLSPYGPDLKVTLQASCKYDAAYTPVGTFDAAFIDNFRIDIIESVPEIDNKLTVYPNPADDRVYLALNYGLNQAIAQIINLQGEVVRSLKCNGQQLISFDINTLPSGIYAIRIINGTEIINSRFIKTR